MNTDTYYIPVNFTNAGRILGLFEIRNLIEALLLCLPVLYIATVERQGTRLFLAFPANHADGEVTYRE